MQKEVRALQGIGKAGVISRSHLNFKNVVGAVVTDGNIVPGSFVQIANNTNDNTTTQVKGATGQAITSTILGVALFDYEPTCSVINGVNNGITNFNIGDNISVITSGNVFIVFEQTCQIGQYLMLKTDDGTLMASSTGTDANYTNTGWKIFKTTSTAGNNIIEITKAL